MASIGDSKLPVPETCPSPKRVLPETCPPVPETCPLTLAIQNCLSPKRGCLSPKRVLRFKIACPRNVSPKRVLSGP